MLKSRPLSHRADRAARQHSHRGARSASRAHAKAGVTALASVAAVITIALTLAGSLLTPSGASVGRLPKHPVRIVTVTATATATKTTHVPGPTATVTATVPGPITTVTAIVPGPTITVPGSTTTTTANVPGPTTTVPGPTATTTVPGPTATTTVPGPTTTVTTSPSASPTTSPVMKMLTDFAQQSAGLYLPSGQLLGTGVDQTTYQLVPHTSTKTDPSTGTNLLELMRAGGLSSAEAATMDLGGFTVEGTDQTSSLKAYGGLILGYGTGSKVHDLKVTGIPGYSSSPPGETFALELWRSNAATLSNVTLDGYRKSDGAQVGATLLGYSYTTGVHTVTNLKANHARYGFGLAMYQTAGTYNFSGGCDLSNNRKAINIEESIGGAVYNFDGCDFRGTTGAPYVAQVTSLTSSSKVFIRDPVVDSWPLKVNCYSSSALSGANRQLDSDIHLLINGVDVSGDPTKLQITHL